MTSTIDATETTLPELLKQVEQGDTIILVAGAEQTPIATLTPASPSSSSHRLGFLKHLHLPHIPDSMWFDPLPPEELALWEEGSPTDPFNWTEDQIRKVNAESDAKWK